MLEGFEPPEEVEFNHGKFFGELFPFVCYLLLEFGKAMVQIGNLTEMGVSQICSSVMFLGQL